MSSPLELASAALLAAFVAIPSSQASRFYHNCDPSKFGDVTKYPNGGNNMLLIALIDGRSLRPITEAMARTNRIVKQGQEADLLVRFWLYKQGTNIERAQAFIARRREVLDAIKGVFATDTWGSGHWKLDWDGSAQSIAADEPYAAGEIDVTVILHE